MLEETHRRVSKEIARELNLGEREASLLEVGSINPDSWADFPHHHGKESEIAEHILAARRLFLKGDDECYYELGIALHYIQDMWTLRPRMGDKHTRYEILINAAPIVDDSEFKKKIRQAHLPTKAELAYLDFFGKISKGVIGLTDAECNEVCIRKEIGVPLLDDILARRKKPSFVTTVSVPISEEWKYLRGLGLKTLAFALQQRPTSWSNPILDLNFSYRICLKIARRVFSRKHDEGDWYDIDAQRHDLESAAKEAEEIPKEAEKGGRKHHLIIWTFILLAFTFYAAGLVSTSQGSPLFGVFLIIFGLVCTILGLVSLFKV